MTLFDAQLSRNTFCMLNKVLLYQITYLICSPNTGAMQRKMYSYLSRLQLKNTVEWPYAFKTL